MEAINQEKGMTFFEVLVSLSILVSILALLLPVIVDIRQKNLSWQDQIKIQQEAMRFFAYLESRNSCYVKEQIQDQRLTLFVCRDGSATPIVRTITLANNKIFEQENGNTGYIELARHVQSVQYRSRDSGIEINVTLSLGNATDTFSWILRRNLDRE